MSQSTCSSATKSKTIPELPHITRRGLDYYADAATIAQSPIAYYRVQSNNPNISQFHSDLARDSFSICFKDVTFNVFFLTNLLYLNGMHPYASRQELVSNLRKRGLTLEHIEQQLAYTQQLLELSDTAFNELLNHLGQKLSSSNNTDILRENTLKILIVSMVGQEKAELIFKTYGQDFGHYMLVSVAVCGCKDAQQKIVLLEACHTCNLPAGTLNIINYRYRLMSDGQGNPKKNEIVFGVSGNKIIAKIFNRDDLSILECDPIYKIIMQAHTETRGFTPEEIQQLSLNMHAPSIYYISPSAIACHFMDTDTGTDILRRFVGTTTHEITISTVKHQSVTTGFTASNYVLAMLGLIPGIVITEELYALEYAEQNLRSSILLCQELGIITDEATKNYVYWLDHYLRGLDLRTATPKQLNRIASQINTLHIKGTSSLRNQDVIPSEIKEFVELQVQLQRCFYNTLTMMTPNPDVCEFDNKWLALTPVDIIHLPMINLHLLTAQYNIEISGQQVNQPLFLHLMMATNNLKDYIISNSNNGFSESEKEAFVEELNALKNEGIPLIDRMHRLRYFLLKYNNSIICKNPADPHVASISSFIQQLADCMKPFLDDSGAFLVRETREKLQQEQTLVQLTSINAVPYPNSACSAASSSASASLLASSYRWCACRFSARRQPAAQQEAPASLSPLQNAAIAAPNASATAAPLNANDFAVPQTSCNQSDSPMSATL